MPRKLNLSDLLTMGPCSPDKRVALFGTRTSLTVRQAIKSGVAVSDILWVAGRLGLGSECAEFASGCSARSAAYADAAASSYADASYVAARSSSYAADAARSAADASSYAARSSSYAAARSSSYAAYAARYAARYADAASLEAAAQISDIIRIFANS